MTGGSILASTVRTVNVNGTAFLGQIRSSQIRGAGAATALGNQILSGSTRSHLIWERQDLADLKEGEASLQKEIDFSETQIHTHLMP